MTELFLYNDQILLDAPFSMAVSGPTSCGKTFWVYTILKHLKQMIKSTSEVPKKVLFCYSLEQPLYFHIRKVVPEIVFYEGLPSLDYIYDFADGKPVLIVLDDLVNEILGNQDMLKLFTQGTHHRSISVIFMTQNLFQQGKHARTIALNVKYLVLFSNPRDNFQVSYLGRQIFPGRSGRLAEAFENAVSQRHRGYLFVDLSPISRDDLRLRTNVFPDDTFLIVYMPK